MTTQQRQRTAAAMRAFAAGDKAALKSLPPEALIFGAGRVTIDPVAAFDDEVARKSPAYAAARAQIKAEQRAAEQREADFSYTALREADLKARAPALAVLFGCTTEQAGRWLRTGKFA